jgi:ribosomal protein S27AE
MQQISSEIDFENTETCPNCGTFVGNDSTCPNCGVVLCQENELNLFDEDGDVD